MTEERRQQLLDVVQKYNDMMRADTKDMTNEERVFFMECHIEAISKPLEMFKGAVAKGQGDKK
jgi:hypothetical protein